MAGDTYYEVLGIAADTDPAAVRKAYVGLARQFHPDFHVGASAEVQTHAEAKMREINEAWAVLGSSQARVKYDRDLRASGRMHETGSAATSRPRSRQAAAAASGSAPPRWLTMLPALSLVVALACFALGMVTGLPALLAGAIGFAALGAVLFVVVPMVALKRARGVRHAPRGPTVSA